MNMCPYCGEDVPDDSSACWKCGTEIQRGEGGGGGGETIEQRNVEGKTGGGPKVECPFCQAQIPARAMRCNECGRPVQRVNVRANWMPAAWGVFGLVLVGTLIGVIVSFVRAHQPAPDPGRDTPITIKPHELGRIYLRSGGPEQRRREIWESEHKGKFVAWEGVIVDIDPSARIMGLADDGLGGRATAVVQFKPGQDLSGLKVEKTIRYSARLEDFRDGQFHLSLGVLLED
ncbi:MAG: zinc ribbon domain-containing protein [Planctomycetota bacterium]|nr:zinc ribbon domain-containing protein [Planctomycetota bacterium]